MNHRITILGLLCLALAGCGDAPSGKSCLGSNGDTLVEALSGKCKAGDIVATKRPASYCNFAYSVTFNAYDSAFCVYTGSEAKEQLSQ